MDNRIIFKYFETARWTRSSMTTLSWQNTGASAAMSSTRRWRGAGSSRTWSTNPKKVTISHTVRILPKNNWCWSTSFSTKSSSRNTCTSRMKPGSSSSIPRMSAMSISLFVLQSGLLNSASSNSIITSTAQRKSVSSFSTRNSIPQMNSPSAFPVLPTSQTGKKATLSICLFF